ncbi:SLOG family protein [Paenibacillus sp. sgz500958]|uniref:SLOG family protein n=1 Tax=Paenibacillus sp. sgz500958 TaxID=3242475 RepID=UPI0036D253D7
MKNLLVTGYRAHELGIFDNKHQGIPYIKKALSSRIVPLAEEGLEWVLTPGQYGVDLWACEVVLELKNHYPGLKLGIITAHAAPEEKWKEEKQEEYRRIVGRADYYGAVSKQPYEGSWQFRARDDLLLRKSDGMLLFYDEEAAEGSPKFFKERAMKLHEATGYGLYIIHSEDIQAIAEEENMSRYE